MLGPQDAGHAGVATGCGVFSQRSLKEQGFSAF